MRTIHFYRTEAGACPIEEFLDTLSGKQAQKVLWVLRLIEELSVIPSWYFKKLVGSDEIWEVRAQLGNDIFRLLGFFADSTLLVLTNGFAKKDRKTPRDQISIATRRKREYLSRLRKR